LAQTVPINSIVVVDNASTDDSVRIIREHYSTVTVIANKTNLGFAEANNVGIASVSADWVLALNPDAYLAPDWVERLLAFTSDRPKIGMLGGMLLRHSDDPKALPIVDSLGIDIYRNRLVEDRGADAPVPTGLTEPFRVFGVCAAAALYRRKMLDDTGVNGSPFPADFFSYLEDVDLAWRCWRMGWEAWIVPAAVGWHIRGGSPTGSRFSRELIHRNRYWLIARNEPLLPLLAHLPQLLFYEGFLILKMIRHPYLLRSLWQGITGVPRNVRLRRKLSDHNTQPLPFTAGGTRSVWNTVKGQLWRRKSGD
jgi:GT2 family glycosyltransferase